MATQLKNPDIDRSPWLLTILAHLDWVFRLEHVPVLSKDWTRLSTSNLLKHFYCQRLTQEHGVYSPQRPPPDIGNWGNMFQELFPLRSMWVPSQQHVLYRAAFEERQDRQRFLQLTGQEEEDEEASAAASLSDDNPPALGHSAPPSSRYTVGVCVRFRPTRQRPSESKQEEHDAKRKAMKSARFLLPLHQRLQIIKIRDSCSTKVALHTLQQEGAWFDASWKKKPLNHEEDKENEDATFGSGSQESRIQSIDSGTGVVIMVAPSIGMRPFTFDHVLEGRVSQSTTYDLTTKRLVLDMCNGFNSSVIMYGQTGSGKTWTCFGEANATGVPVKAGSSNRNRGLVQRACEEVFVAAKQRMALGIECQLSVSYVEVYGNDVTDLLKNGERVGHNKVSSQRYVMSGQAKRNVNSLEDIRDALATGDAQKRRAATAMNDRSSRAHSLFVITMNMFNTATGVRMSSDLYLADLGGSEQVKRSQVHHGGYDKETGTAKGFVMGQNMKEAVNINLGLLALKKCIGALNEGSDYVPYQDSKLTMLLSAAIGGDSKATVLICASPENNNAVETLQALRFGEKCRQVENEASNNASAIQDIIATMDKEIDSLETTIRAKERWETTETVRKDGLVEEGTYEAKLQEQKGGEIVKTGVVVGAEKERARLEKVIMQRAALTGEDFQAKLAEAGFGGMYGGQAKALDVFGDKRFNAQDEEGLKMKGRKVAAWKN